MISPEGLAFKAYEIEELADIYFFRPVGWIVASAASRLHLTPNVVSVLAGLIGAAGGAMLVRPSLGLVSFGLLILHGVFDSADGQLARMTGRVSPLGRVLDGAAGYVTYVVLLFALAWRLSTGGAGPAVWCWMVLTGVCIAVQAQMYDYHRTAYTTYVLKGVPGEGAVEHSAGAHRGVLRLYEGIQRALGGWHPAVERALARRAHGGTVRAEDRARYRAAFYWPVRGWNLLGDNTRFYAIGAFALVGRLDLFFPFILLPMNTALACLWIWQARADRRFLGRL